jgi:uncharacterized small protein (DUF1192 family)
MPNDNATDLFVAALGANPPTDWELFQAAIRYIDDRIAWLQAERSELLRDEIERVRAALAAHDRDRVQS